MPLRGTVAKSTSTKIAVVGPGAIGGLLAGRFAAAGFRVLLIGRDLAWLRSFRASGLRVEGGVFGAGKTWRGKNVIPAVKPAGPACDIIFFCIKSFDTAEALRGSRGLIGPSTAVITIQNGLSHRKNFEKLGPARTVLGVGFVAADRIGPFHFRHMGGREFVLATHSGNTAAVKLASQLLRRAGWRVSRTASEDRLLWTKAAVNASGNPLGTLTGRTNGELVRIAPLRDIMFRAVREAAQVANAVGNPLLYKDIEGYLVRAYGTFPAQPNSMLQDIRAGHRTEIEAIVGPFLAGARRKRITVPVLQSMYDFVKSLEQEICR